MRVIYRISDAGYKKEKPNYINNEKCLYNAALTFQQAQWIVIADNVSADTDDMIQKYVKKHLIKHVNVGHGAGTFNLALDEALTYDDNEIVYFIENDYLHKPISFRVLNEGFELGASFVSLYDHPDKYLDPEKGGNPYCKGGAEDTRVYLTNSCHWKITNSTTMTFAAKVSTLKRTEKILRKHTSGRHPDDFKMFLELRANNELLITPLPGYSTHGETAWLTPLTNWKNYDYEISTKNLQEIFETHSAQAKGQMSWGAGHGDKGTVHSYIPVYERLFSPYRDKKINFLEIGVAFGESLEMWYEYFSKESRIHGLDNQTKEIATKLEDNRFDITITDQTDPNIVSKLGNEKFDIILDDGSHIFEHQIKSFHLLKDSINKGGLYVIEDIDNIDEKYNDFMELKKYCLDCEIIDLRKEKNRYDDVIAVYKF